MFDGVLHKFCFVFTVFVWCPCMAINVSVQYSGGLLSDIILSAHVITIGEPVYMP